MFHHLIISCYLFKLLLLFNFYSPLFSLRLIPFLEAKRKQSNCNLRVVLVILYTNDLLLSGIIWFYFQGLLLRQV